MWSSEQTRAHIEAVGERIAASAPDDLRELSLLVAAVHEERDPDRLREAARAAGGREVRLPVTPPRSASRVRSSLG